MLIQTCILIIFINCTNSYSFSPIHEPTRNIKYFFQATIKIIYHKNPTLIIYPGESVGYGRNHEDMVTDLLIVYEINGMTALIYDLKAFKMEHKMEKQKSNIFIINGIQMLKYGFSIITIIHLLARI